MGVILFEDAKVAGLSPAALARPAAMIPCGGYRLADLVEELGLPVHHAPRPHLRGVVSTVCSEPPQEADFHLLLNGRLVPSVASLRHLQDWLAQAEPAAVFQHETLVAALVPADKLNEWDFAAETLLENLDLGNIPRRELAVPLLEHPHQIIQCHLDGLAENLGHRIEQGDYTQPVSGVYLGPEATLDPSATVDTSAGCILLERGTKVGPHSHLRGPLLLGGNTVVLPHACLGTHTFAEQNCKLGGEISCSIISSYSNKAHYGFLGHSYLGSWVNLGAGTTNSNLKNTYGEINQQTSDGRIATGMQFLGCLIGDYTKSAIQTGILTGKTVGVCSMLYGMIAEDVPSFVNYAKQFGKLTAMSPQVAATIQERTFARRGLTQNETDQQLIRDLYLLTKMERESFADNLPEEPLVL